MDSDPQLITRAQVKAALACLGLADPPREDRLNFIRLEIADGYVKIVRLRRGDDGRPCFGVRGPGSEITDIPIEHKPTTYGPIGPEETRGTDA